MSRREGQAGYALVALVAATTILLITMAAAVPAWRYVVKNEREEELVFRGGQIADAVLRYQRKRGNALPVSIDALVKDRFLRKPFKDPMRPDGKWRLIRPGEPIVPGPTRPGTGRPGSPPATLVPGQSKTGPGGQTPTTLGPFVGVASFSTDKSLRVFNGREAYNEWLFIAGQPRIIGRPPRLFKPGGLPNQPPFPGPTTQPPNPPGPR